MNKILFASILSIAIGQSTVSQAQWAGSTTPSGSIMRNGDVGIGISPTYPLHIFTNASPLGNYGFIHTDGDAEVGSWVGPHAGIKAGWLGTRSNHPLHFFTNNGQPQITLENFTGNLGIGTHQPFFRLHTMGDGAFQSILSNEAILRVSNHTGSSWGPLASSKCGIFAERVDAQSTGAFLIGRQMGVKGIGNVIGAEGQALGDKAYNSITGVRGSASYTTAPAAGSFANGVSGAAGSASINRGVHGTATSETGQSAYGVWGMATGLADNSLTYGVAGIAINPKGIGVGIYGYAQIANGGSIGGGAYPAASYAGYFAGDVFITTSYYSSDEKFKDDIKPLTSSLDIINKIHPKTYTYKKSDEFTGLNFREGLQYGVIAQDLEKVLPQFVKNSINPEIKDADGNVVSRKFEFKAVDYVSLVPILIAGVQEQQKEIQDQKEIVAEMKHQLDELRTIINGLENNNEWNKTARIPDNTANSSFLEQNNPNPFSRDTEIKYKLPNDAREGYILITDITGKQLMKIVVDTTKNSVMLNNRDLNTGTYIYSLFVNGKKVDSKKMILMNN